MAVLVVVPMLSLLLALQDKEEGKVAVMTWHRHQCILLEACMVLIVVATLSSLLALQDEDKGK